MYYS